MNGQESASDSNRIPANQRKLVNLLRAANEGGADEEAEFWVELDRRARMLPILKFLKSPDVSRDAEDMWYTVLPRIIVRLRNASQGDFVSDSKLLSYIAVSIKNRIVSVKDRSLGNVDGLEDGRAEDRGPGVPTLAHHKSLVAGWFDAVRQMPDLERQVFFDRISNKTFPEIGSEVGKSADQVRHIFKKICDDIGMDPTAFLD